MGILNKVLRHVFFFTLFLGGLVLSISSCSDDTDENLPTCEEYRDSLRCIFQQNAIIGTYICTEACNIAPVFQDYQMVIKAHPDGCPKLLVSNFAALNEFSNPFNGLEISGEFTIQSTLDSSNSNILKLPVETYYSNNNQDTLIILGEGSMIRDTFTFQYRFSLNSAPEKVCITQAIKIDP
jgi:hypothetical protein